MSNLIIFVLGGLMFRYGLDILDNIISWVTLITTNLQNKQSLQATKIQAEIEKINQQFSSDENVIGFQIQDNELDENE